MNYDPSVTFGVMKRFSVPLLLGTTFIDIWIRSVHQSEREIAPYHSSFVPILMALEVNSEAMKNTPDFRPFIVEDLELLVAPIKREPEKLQLFDKLLSKQCVKQLS